MIDPKTGLPPRYLRAPDAARFLGISIRTLEKHRTYGTGPTYRKIGGRIVYSVDDLQAWTKDGIRKSASEKTATRVFPARPLTPAEKASR
ncbi:MULTISPECIES: helix-turn-helix domain-containing protein [Bacteria]|jgi:predicted DNA-binding transcriptional regulator AlpA|uniref:helix-turn-helix transcriptional regulator n=1 Tax=Bacteria TaxID=2 RepID=UPI002446D92B|nr:MULTISPECIES: helix-turn-helix domain-containing protein [unclassified Agrobacterium]MDH0612686.1 helix-turn-helix domain-containing protein [Agrobacterium sp. GD03872]MDH0694550.1 helix-turn-helix domain-containing protein [Agrobacterium sp. GD03871]MDH1058052.1 helix-turn-helix domain-containing protein [Agrobacterium sp. GD03992]MDH2209341.1 helix-turn-helix domain-containing protein [Agrobacterium sp. GD03643]MDH2218832.1 helix-turn-helix domain-containing protein [Agrobacterium sp. GD0